jgi:hypothetical protein
LNLCSGHHTNGAVEDRNRNNPAEEVFCSHWRSVV